MALKLANNAASKFAIGISTTDTLIAVTPGDGAKFPALGAGDWFPLTCVKSDGSFEVMRGTARATDQITVTRAQEGTAPLTFVPGERVELRITSAGFGAYLQAGDLATAGAAAGFLIKTGAGGTDSLYMPISGDGPRVNATTTGTERSLLVQNNTGSGDGNVAALGFLCQGAYGIKLYLRADGYFGLGGWSTTAWKWYVSNVGDMVASGNVAAYSDERLKTNWREFDDDFIERFAEVKHGIYDRLDIDGVTQVGVSAQSLQDVMKHAVIEDKDGVLTVAYGNAALAAAIRLSRRVIALERKLSEKGVL
ncbi:tail fiber domain-containing protein [Paraburkholderia hospita]|uniref:tail fiber domain-containing protein n=1 Tax=Paraburkholderia hospita TaxID=169430 RepID=UPI0008A7AC9B|nr:tail fiber domain-containing protein [Paraburkholderia hospita]SEH89837.1 Chaperone of endosialidase [Paraburkholderia hospita]